MIISVDEELVGSDISLLTSGILSLMRLSHALCWISNLLGLSWELSIFFDLKSYCEVSTG